MKWYELKDKIYGINEVKTVVRIYEKDGSYWVKTIDEHESIEVRKGYVIIVNFYTNDEIYSIDTKGRAVGLLIDHYEGYNGELYNKNGELVK